MTRRSWLALVTIGVLALAVLAACDSNDITGQVVQNSLIVTNTCPGTGDTALAANTRPFVDFDVAPRANARATTTFVMTHNGVAVPGNILQFGRRWVFVPDQPLDSLQTFECAVAVGVRLKEGQLLRDFVRWTFRTGGSAASDTCG